MLRYFFIIFLSIILTSCKDKVTGSLNDSVIKTFDYQQKTLSCFCDKNHDSAFYCFNKSKKIIATGVVAYKLEQISQFYSGLRVSLGSEVTLIEASIGIYNVLDYEASVFLGKASKEFLNFNAVTRYFNHAIEDTDNEISKIASLNYLGYSCFKNIKNNEGSVFIEQDIEVRNNKKKSFY